MVVVFIGGNMMKKYYLPIGQRQEEVLLPEEQRQP